MRPTLLAGILFATLGAMPAQAQTVDGARAFFDQVAGNNGTMMASRF
jgi:hypothetical protein